MFFVFRVETPTGLGPWCDEFGRWSGGAGTDWCGNAQALHNHAHEYLKKLKEKEKNNDYRFGFFNLYQMFHYISADYDLHMIENRLSKLPERNLVINQYMVVSLYDTLGDASQCIFNKKRAELVNTYTHDSEYVMKELANYLSFVKKNRKIGNEY